MFNSCMWNVFDYLISKENFLCRFFMHFANLWLLSCLLWGMFGWNLAFQVLFTSLLWIFCSSSQPVSGGMEMLLSNNTFTTSYLVSGGISTGYDCLSFIPLLPDGNQLIIHSYRFLDMEQTKFKFASCAVGKNVHCCILMKAADFTLKETSQLILNLEKNLLFLVLVKVTISSSVLHLKKWSLISLLHLSHHLTCNTCMLFSPSVTMRTINR